MSTKTSQFTFVIGTFFTALFSPFIWLGIEKVWKDFRDQARLIFVFQLMAFVAYVLIPKEGYDDLLFGVLLFFTYNNLILGINLLGSIRYSLGTIDDRRPVFKGFIVALFLWSVYIGLGLFIPILNNKVLIFLIFIVVQLLGWLFLTKNLTNREILYNHRTETAKFQITRHSIILTGSIFLIFSINSTTITSISYPEITISHIFALANITSCILIGIVNLRRFKPSNWIILALGLQFFLFSLLSNYLGVKPLDVFFSMVSQFFLIVFGLLHFRSLGQNHLIDGSMIFSLALGGNFIGPIAFQLLGIGHPTFLYWGLFVYLMSMVFMISFLKRQDEQISKVDIKSPKIHRQRLIIGLKNDIELEERDENLTPIMDELPLNRKGLVKRDNENNAILYKGQDLELRIHLKNFHKHHDELIERLITTIKEYEEENTAHGKEFFTQEEIEALKNKIREDIADLSYGKGPRFVI